MNTANAWRQIARTIQYKAGASSAVDVLGVLVSPDPKDLVGDLDETERKFVCRYDDLEAATGTTAWEKVDKVIDGTRTYNVASVEISYQGSRAAWVHAEVVG